MGHITIWSFSLHNFNLWSCRLHLLNHMNLLCIICSKTNCNIAVLLWFSSILFFSRHFLYERETGKWFATNWKKEVVACNIHISKTQVEFSVPQSRKMWHLESSAVLTHYLWGWRPAWQIIARYSPTEGRREIEIAFVCACWRKIKDIMAEIEAVNSLSIPLITP